MAKDIDVKNLVEKYKFMSEHEIEKKIERFVKAEEDKIEERKNYPYDSKKYMITSTRIYSIRKTIKKWTAILDEKKATSKP